MSVIPIGTTTTVTLSGLTGNGVPLNAAAVTWTLTDGFGDPITSGTLTYVTSSSGDYTGSIGGDVTAGLMEGETYHVEITAAQGGVQGFWRIAAQAAYTAAPAALCC